MVLEQFLMRRQRESQTPQMIRYDQAAKEYAEACSAPKQIRRHNMGYWKKMLTWLDQRLAEEEK